jgi:uncharacterized MAPEG superfamily protein
MNAVNLPHNGMGKRLVSILGGALVGCAGIALFFASGLGKAVALLGPGPLILAGSGLIYLLMALIVGLGAAIPAIGSRFLNVADREDLDEQRGMLLAASASFALFAALQIVLACAGPGGTISDGGAIVFSLAALALAVGLSFRQARQNDELLRQLSWEGSGIGLIVLFVLLGGWAGAVLFAGAPAIDPHALIAALFQSMLVGSFIAAGMRGLLHQD